MSGSQLRKLEGQLSTTHSGPGVAEWLREHGPLIINDDREALAAAGVIRVVDGDLVPNYRSDRRVGYVGFVQNPATGKWWVVTAVASSGADRRLPSMEVSGGLSAWAQLVTWTWTFTASARILRFLRDDRMSRDLEVFAPINGRVKERPRAVYWWGDERIDPHKDNWRAIIGAQTSASGAIDTKTKTFGGRARGWKEGRWTEGELYLPLGLHLPENVNAHGVTAKSKIPSVDPQTAPTAQRMWERAAQGWNMMAIAVDEAASGARNARGALLALRVAPLMDAGQRDRTAQLSSGLAAAEQGMLDDVLAGADRPRTHAEFASCRQAATEYSKRVFQYANFYRTGHLWKMFTSNLPGQTSIDGESLTFLVADVRTAPTDLEPYQVRTIAEYERDHPDHPIFKIRETNPDRFEEICALGFTTEILEMPTPVKLTEAQWNAALANIPAEWLEQLRTGYVKRQSKPTAPLAQLRWLDDDGDHDWRIQKDHCAYVLLRGRIGAPSAQASAVARVKCADLHRSLGKNLLVLASTTELAPDPLRVLTTPPAAQRTDPVAVAESAVARITHAIAAEEKTYKGLVRDRADLNEDDEDYDLDRQMIQENIDETKQKRRTLKRNLVSCN